MRSSFPHSLQLLPDTVTRKTVVGVVIAVVKLTSRSRTLKKITRTNLNCREEILEIVMWLKEAVEVWEYHRTLVIRSLRQPEYFRG